MKAVVFFIFICLSYFVVVPQSFSATTIINPISIDTSTPIIGDAFNLTASMSGALSGSNYYIKCRIGANASSPLNDGQTYNPQTSQWLDDTGPTGAWINMPQITAVADELWQYPIRCRIKTSASDEGKVIFISACLNSDNSCGSSFKSVNSLTVNPIFPTATPTLIPTPTNAPTNTPAPAPTSSPSNTPTPTPTTAKTPTPTPSHASTPVNSTTSTSMSSPPPMQQETLSSSVLGETTQNGGFSLPTDTGSINGDSLGTNNSKSAGSKWFQVILILIGVAFIIACGVLTYREIKKGELIQDETE